MTQRTRQHPVSGRRTSCNDTRLTVCGRSDRSPTDKPLRRYPPRLGLSACESVCTAREMPMVATKACPVMINWAGLVDEGGCSVRQEWSVGHREVSHLSHAPGGVPHAVTFASAVAQDIPGLHVR